MGYVRGCEVIGLARVEGEGAASETRGRFSPLQTVHRNELTTIPILVRIWWQNSTNLR